MKEQEAITREEVLELLNKIKHFNKQGVRSVVFRNNTNSGSIQRIIETLVIEINSLHNGVDFYKALFRSKEEECDYVGLELYKLRKSMNYNLSDFYFEEEIEKFEKFIKEEEDN